MGSQSLSTNKPPIYKADDEMSTVI